jgi:hypothetical protein
MPSLRAFPLGLLLLLAACAPAVVHEPAAPTATPPAATARSAADVITAEHALAHVAYLASDELRGRDTPSPGLEAAADYIVARFREWGVRPGAGNGEYVQRWPYREVRFDRAALTTVLRSPAGSVSPHFGSEYFLAAGPASEIGAELYFGGVAATSPRPLPAEARGSAVAFYLPGELDADWQNPVVAALQSAAQAGAAALVFVLDPRIDASEVGQLAGALEAQSGGLPLTIVGLRYDVAQRFFGPGGIDLEAVRETQPATTVTLSRVRDASFTTRSAFERAESMVPNVIGMIEGSDPELRNTYIAFSAHFDHVGVGVPDATGDSIYNGADDNASGTSAVLELARAFAAGGERPRRSILFVLVSGEEKGLLGSAYFVENPTVPIDAIVANINLDMVGRNAPDSVIGIGLDYSSLGPLAVRTAQQHPEVGLSIMPDPMPQERLFFRSDHFNFARMEIPALFFTTGLHEDYHRPSDTVDRIDADKIARIARLSYHIAMAIGNDPQRPTWTEQGLREVRGMTGAPGN